tara:strand:+ start:556 stop:966 length:411 start_codon:yes stop_codon:yes gene_type:complete
MEENSHTTEDFRVFSLSIELITLIYGLFMIIWAFSISIIAESSSITSLVPAFIGFPLVLIGFISMFKPTLRKALMHIAVLIGILAFLGGLDFFRGMFNNYYAGLSKLMLLITGFGYVYFCVQSFLFVRRQKKLNPN